MTKRYLKSREYFDGFIDWRDYTAVEPNRNMLINVLISYPQEEADTECFSVCFECLVQNDLRAGVTPKSERICHEPTDCDEVGCSFCKRQPRPEIGGES